MKRYTFRLARLLEHRERLESEAQQRFAAVQRRLTAEEIALAAIELECAQVSDTLCQSHQNLDHDELRRFYLRIDFLARSIQTRKMNILTMSLEHAAAHAELLQASKHRRMLETLKERGVAEHTAETLRREHADLDEANSRRMHGDFHSVKKETSWHS